MAGVKQTSVCSMSSDQSATTRIQHSSPLSVLRFLQLVKRHWLRFRSFTDSEVKPECSKSSSQSATTRAQQNSFLALLMLDALISLLTGLFIQANNRLCLNRDILPYSFSGLWTQRMLCSCWSQMFDLNLLCLCSLFSCISTSLRIVFVQAFSFNRFWVLKRTGQFAFDLATIRSGFQRECNHYHVRYT